MAEAAVALSHSRVLHIAVPIVLANATVPILGAVDTGVVGQMGAAAPIGAVGIGAIILTAIYWIFGFLRMGTTGMTAQALGAGDNGEVAALLTRALLIGLGGGVVLILVQSLLFWAAFLIAPASPEVEGMARAYMVIRVWSAPAAIGLYGITGWLIAQERTRAVLILQLWMNGLNIGLDLWFVMGLDWGVSGVAFATFLAEWSGFALGLFLCREAFRQPDWRDWARVFDRVILRRMAGVNTDIMLRSLMLQTLFVSFLFYGANYGDTTLAANQILLQFLYITAYAMDGFAFGAETLVGQAIGARDRSALRRAAYLCSLWGGMIVIILALIFALFGGIIIDVMTNAPDVRSAAREYLVWMVLAPLVGWAPWMLDGIFIGATQTRDMRNMTVVSFVIYGLALLVFLPLFDNHGLWAALLVSFAARGVTLAVKYPKIEARL